MTQLSSVAIIPARGGSKGISKKNTRLFLGRPLVEWTISACLASSAIERVIVSSDSQEILDLAHFAGAETHRRPDIFATDEATSESVVIDVITSVKGISEYDVVFLVQPTSPLTLSSDLDSAMQQFVNGGYDSLVTATESHDFIWNLDGDLAIPNYDPHLRPRRQEMSGRFRENGAFYVTKMQIWKKHSCRLEGYIGLYPMQDWQSLEIDSELDWEILEQVALSHDFIAG